jgi:hypothetical protein
VESELLLLLLPLVLAAGVLGTTSMLMRAEWSAAALPANEQLACADRMLSELHPAGAAALAAVLLPVVVSLATGHEAEE